MSANATYLDGNGVAHYPQGSDRDLVTTIDENRKTHANSGEVTTGVDYIFDHAFTGSSITKNVSMDALDKL